MLGASLDYFILRSLAHSRNLATEEQLDARSSHVSAESLEEEMPKFRKIIGRFEGHLPVDPGLSYLDMGCGTGELTIAFAKLGVRRITGVDFLPRHIERARAYTGQLGMAQGVQFICRDLREWVPEEKFDVLLSFDAFEHIDEPELFLRKMTDFVAPGGIAVLAFGPLFHSPYGDHMWDFYRLQIPWRGILFSEQAMLRVRRECFRPGDAVNSYHEVKGGLNLMRYSEFLKHVRATGWKFDYLAVNTFLKRLPPLRLISDIVMRIPGLRDYFVHNVYAVLRRAA
jgi:SAM-dependent methyltransferase